MLSRFHLMLERKGRADGHSDRRTYIFAISITRVSMLTRDKKRNVYAVRVTFHPCAVLTPPQTPCYPVVHMGSYGRRNHSCTISAQSVRGLGSYGNPNFHISYT